MKAKEYSMLTIRQQKIVVDNLRLAKYVIRKFYSGLRLSYSEWQELFSHADGGLVIAAGKFRGDFISKHTGEPVAFSTYAICWIRQQCNLWLKKRCRRRQKEVAQSEVYSDPDDSSFFDVSADDTQSSFELAELVELCLKWVRDDYRQILTLRYIEGRTFEETAEVLGCTKQNIQQMEVKAIRQIRQRMSPSLRKTWMEHQEVIMKREEASGSIRKLASRR